MADLSAETPIPYRAAAGASRAIIGSGDLGGLFVRAHRWLLRHPSIMAARGSRTQDLTLLDEFAVWLHPDSLMEGTGDHEGDLLLRTEAREALQKLLFRNFLNAPAPQAFDAVVSLLCSIDRICGPRLVDHFFARLRASDASAVPLSSALPFPKPHYPFSSAEVDADRFAPAAGVHSDYLTLERWYLGTLAVPLHTGAGERPPALHAASRREAVAPRTWRVAMLGALTGFEEIDWQTDPERTRFWGCSLRPASRPAVVDALRALLAECSRCDVDLILLPELNGDPEVLEVLQGFAAESETPFPWIIVGAMHEAVEGAPGTYRNRPRIFTPDRELLWDYWKSDPVRARFHFEDGSEDELEEALARGTPPVVAVDGPFGRLAVIICKDFLCDEVRLRVEHLRATTVVVLAMTSQASVEEFSVLARGFAARNRAVSLFCNCSTAYWRELSLRERRDGAAAAAERRDRVRWELGIVHTNTITGTGEVACHLLPAAPGPVLEIYTLTATNKGLRALARTPPPSAR